MTDDTTLTVAVLGTGIMGAPMARNLAKAGFDVRVWNRTSDKAEPLAADGAIVCASPREAADGADVVITMLADDDAVASVVDGDDGAFSAGGSPIWLQMSTVGVEGTERLSSLAADRGIRYVDAPVLGTKQPAEDGALTVLASGDDDVRDVVQPVFDAIGSRTTWLGKTGQATRLKLALNSWVLALTSATAEALALADGLGVDPKLFLDTIEGGPLDVKYAHVKGGAMLRGEFPTAFPVDGAAKDARLIVEAASAAGVQARVADAVATHMQNAADAGHGRDDMAAVWDVVRRP
jgi:3-hydroxyisobutyrate dehydrogenase